MPFEIAAIAKVTAETIKKAGEVASKVDKAGSTVDKVGKALDKAGKAVDKTGKVVDTVAANKDSDWGSGLVKSGVEKGIGEVANSLSDTLKDYLNKVEAPAEGNDVSDSVVDEKQDPNTESEKGRVDESKLSLKDYLNAYLDGTDSTKEIEKTDNPVDENGDIVNRDDSLEDTDKPYDSDKFDEGEGSENNEDDSDGSESENDEDENTSSNTEVPKDQQNYDAYDKDAKEKGTDRADSSSEVVEEHEYDENGTRELTEEEKQYYKDKLGWSDEKIKKCTVDKDGVIHYKTDRCDLEGKTSDNGVPYERKQVVINGVKIEGVFPVFASVYDTELAPDNYKSNAYAKECNSKLKEAIQSDSELRNKFTDEQLKDIEEGRTPRGYVWHHNEEPGKMQLVKQVDHDRCIGGAAHTGGNSLWGSDSVDKKTKGESF